MNDVATIMTIKAAQNAGNGGSAFLYGSASPGITAGVIIIIGLIILFILWNIIVGILKMNSTEEVNYYEAPDFPDRRDKSTRSSSDARDRASEDQGEKKL